MLCLHEWIWKIHLGRIQQKIRELSNDDKLLSVIGDFKTKSEKISDISLKVLKICKKLKLQMAFNYQFDYVLISNVISSEKYSSGTFKNLYSEQKSLFLRICFDDDKVLKTPNVEENI